ncbi:MAG: hypothetical protein HFE66_00270 [Clostridiales bacterium]|jgi:hypothetical protein|nr:hypothetical protein [Clostridiales bacterium]
MDHTAKDIQPVPTGVPVKKEKITADSEAARYLHLQMQVKKESRGADVLLILLTLGFIYVMAILFWVLPDSKFSAQENRVLASAPEISAENFFSGKLTEQVSDYMADQFPFRDFFVGMKAFSETVQLKGQNNGVIFGSDGYLTTRVDYPNETILKTNLDAAAKFQQAAEEQDISCTAALVGRKQDVCDEYLPPVYGSYYSDRIWGVLEDITGSNGLAYLNLRDPLRSRAADGEAVYYKTDHHWTSLGAYYAYVQVMESLGGAPLALGAFTAEEVSHDFYGTTWSASGAKWAAPDSIVYYHYEDEDAYTMTIQDNTMQFEDYAGCTYEERDGKQYAIFDSFYVREFLEEKDQYASFLGGNFGYTHITKNGDDDRQTLLVLKDSFAHSMVPFLARHYDLILIDLRYYKASMLQFCLENDIDQVLMLYNMETLTEGDYLKVLQAGLGKSE